MNIIKHKKIFISISAILFVLAIFTISILGLNLGIDFKGGTAIEISFTEDIRPESKLITELLSNREQFPEVSIVPLGEKSYILKMQEITPETRELITTTISNEFSDMRLDSYTTIGPSVGKELARKAILSFIFVSLGIIIFIAISFRKVSYPLKSWKYGLVAIMTLLHDVLIPVAVFAILSSVYQVEVDTLFVVAILTILGLSVSDTIVIFDRIRENIKLEKSKFSFAEVVNRSINESYGRSLMTSVTVILALVSLVIWGPKSTQLLASMLTVGMFLGTYSSIFLASPLLVMWQEFEESKKLKKA